MKRHFTVTAFVSANGFTLLHWHRGNQMWLPPGGHVEPDEDPVQAALREAEEETGLEVRLLRTAPAFRYAAPPQLTAPVTIMVEDIPATVREPAHQHIDLIYFARPAEAGRPDVTLDGWRWVSRTNLAANTALLRPGNDHPVPVPEDVRVLGMAAIDHAAQEI